MAIFTPTQQKGHTEYDPQIDAYIEGYCSGKGMTSEELAGDGDHFSIVYDAAAKHAVESLVTLKNPASSPPDTTREILFSNGKEVMYGFYGTHMRVRDGDPMGFVQSIIHSSEQGSDEYEENVIWWMELPDPK